MNAAIALPTIGSAGRTVWSIARRAPQQAPKQGHSDYSSFCLTCASWYFSESHRTCTKCGAPIYQWVPNEDLRFFRSRTSLGGF